MRSSNRRPSLAAGFLAVVVMAACGSNSVIGHQDGGAGAAGTGVNPGTAGVGGGGSGGTTGAAGNFGVGGDLIETGTAGTSGDAGSPGTAGALGSAGVLGSAGTGGTADGCASAAGGSVGTGVAFLPAVQYPTNRYSLFVTLGDLNGDGRPDLVVTNEFAADQSDPPGLSGSAGRPFSDGGSVSVFLSEGSSGYAPARHYYPGSMPTSTAVGDLNGDGAADVAVSNAQSVTVLLNDGAGVLSVPVSYASGVSPSWVAMGDLNGDGKNDLVVANRGAPPAGADVTVLLNIGNRMFTATNYPAGTSAVHVAIGDLDDDGRPDLIVSSGASVNVLTNEVNRFGPPASYGSGTNPSNAVIADLNGDGKSDLAVGRETWGAGVLLRVPTSVFAAAVIYPLPSARVAVGDLNADGKPDLVGSTNDPCGGVTFLPNVGNGTFGASGSIGVSLRESRSVTVGDLNADGKPDIVVPHKDGVAVLLNAAP